MNEVIPCEESIAFIEPYYPDEQRRRKPQGIEKMLRMYLLLCWFNLSDESIEYAIYDTVIIRRTYSLLTDNNLIIYIILLSKIGNFYKISK